MSTAIKNTIILVAVFLITVSAGYYSVSHKLKSRVETVENKFEEKLGELELLRASNKMFDVVEQRLESVKKAWRKMPKRIYDRENSTVSFAYFNKIALEKGSYIEYNYSLSGQNTEDDLNSSSYTLVGQASLRALYNYIWKLEHYTSLYRIEELDIKPVAFSGSNGEKNYNLVNFALLLKTFSLEKTGFEEQDDMPEYKPVRLPRNPFYPLVREELPENKENLPDVRSATLIGLTGKTAYIRDGSNKTWFIGLGDKVYLGALTRISTAQNIAEFTLNEGGILNKVILELFSK